MVIGLLIGGVLKGQELIGNARTIATIRQISDYKAALQIFYATYDFYPGDIVSPSRVIPNCSSAPCSTSGNGNGVLDVVQTTRNTYAMHNIVDITLNGNSDLENFWRHLVYAGLISGIQPPDIKTPRINGYGNDTAQRVFSKYFPSLAFPVA